MMRLGSSILAGSAASVRMPSGSSAKIRLRLLALRPMMK